MTQTRIPSDINSATDDTPKGGMRRSNRGSIIATVLTEPLRNSAKKNETPRPSETPMTMYGGRKVEPIVVQKPQKLRKSRLSHLMNKKPV